MCQNDYESIYAKLARNAVLQIAGDFEAPAYWLNRTQVGDAMKQNLRVELIRAYTDVTGFMLLKIDLPDVYEGAIVTTEVTNQQILTYTQYRDVNLTEQETENIKAVGLAQIQIINSNATSFATKILNKGAGLVAKQNIEYTTLALADVQTKLNFTAAQKSLLEYFYYQRLNGLTDDTKNKLFVGVNATLIDQ